MDELKQEQIETKFTLGDKIILHLDTELEFIQDVIPKISENISDQIIEKIPQVRKYSLKQ